MQWLDVDLRPACSNSVTIIANIANEPIKSRTQNAKQVNMRFRAAIRRKKGVTWCVFFVPPNLVAAGP